MNCREKILSEDYMSILLDYVPEEADQEDEAFCYQKYNAGSFLRQVNFL